MKGADLGKGVGELSGLSLIIPARRDESRLDRTLEEYVPALSQSGRPFEILIVTDDAEGATSLPGCGFADPRVRSLQSLDRLGKGGAVILGFRHAVYDHLAFLDADGPIPPSDLLRMDALLSDYDCVVASRRIASSRVIRQRPITRRVLSAGWNALARALLAIPVHDSQCGAKSFRRESILAVLPQLSVMRWAFDVDVLFQLRRAGYRWKEVGVHWRDGPGSKLSVGEAVPEMFAALIGIRLLNPPISNIVPLELRERIKTRMGA